jgi:hypothetical protein
VASGKQIAMDVPSVGSAGLRFDRRLRLLVAAAVATALLASGVPGPVSATIYSPPWADAMWAHFPGSGGLDTTTSMNYVRDGFASEYEAFSTNPVSAHVALGTSYAQSDAIWWMAGHAGAGVIQTYNATTGWSSIYTSKSIGGTCAAPNDCLSNYTSTVMHRIRLMVFMGCKSGVLTGGDSLPLHALALGVDSTVGFSQDLGFIAESNHWAQKFATYAMYPAPRDNSVAEAAAMATTYLGTTYGQYWGYDSYVIYGGSVHVEPARYGS